MRIERVREKSEVIEITAEVRIPQTNIILEKGDRIMVISDAKSKKKEEEPDEDDDDEEEDEEMEVEEKKKKKTKR